MALIKVEVDGYRCDRCQHEWLPKDRQSVQLPTVCPKCKSPYWNVPRREKAAKAPAKAKSGKGRKGN